MNTENGTGVISHASLVPCQNMVEYGLSAFGHADSVRGRLFKKLATAATRPNFGHSTTAQHFPKAAVEARA